MLITPKWTPLFRKTSKWQNKGIQGWVGGLFKIAQYREQLEEGANDVDLSQMMDQKINEMKLYLFL